MNRRFYLVIGAQKCGTTSLYHMFESYPHINLANRKETKFFTFDHLYDTGLNGYLSTFFPNSVSDRPFLDIDPSYLYYDVCAERIHRTLGDDVRFIVVLRNPAKRAWSHYTMERYRRHESLSFAEALAAEKDRIVNDNGILFYSYASRGLYSSQLQRYFDLFPREYFEIFIFEEDFIGHKENMMRRVCQFMQVPHNPELLQVERKMNPARTVKSPALDKLVRGKVINIEPLKRFAPYRAASKFVRGKLHDMNVSLDTEKLDPSLEKATHQRSIS